MMPKLDALLQINVDWKRNMKLSIIQGQIRVEDAQVY